MEIHLLLLKLNEMCDNLANMCVNMGGVCSNVTIMKGSSVSSTAVV